VQINTISNVGVSAYVNRSEQLYSMLEEMKDMPSVENVAFAEIVKVVEEKKVNFFKAQATAIVVKDEQGPVRAK